MNQQRKSVIPKWLSITIRIFMLSIFLIIAIVGLRNRKANIDFLYREHMHGKIIKFENLHKGTVSVWLDNVDTPYILTGFSYYLDTLLVGDSLFKERESYKIFYYKRNLSLQYKLFDTFNIYPK